MDIKGCKFRVFLTQIWQVNLKIGAIPKMQMHNDYRSIRILDS